MKPKTTKYWSSDTEGDWLCMTCEHFTTNNQNYCAGCGLVKGVDLK